MQASVQGKANWLIVMQLVQNGNKRREPCSYDYDENHVFYESTVH